MKKLVIFVSLVFITLFSTAQTVEKGAVFGEKIDSTGAFSAGELPSKVEPGNPVDVKVKGKVVEVCRMEGCWLNLETPDGKMMVKMKGHSFTVPQTIIGKNVVVRGTANVTVIPVDQLKHYAEDAGKTPEEIEAIKEPKKEIVVTATGVLVI